MKERPTKKCHFCNRQTALKCVCGKAVCQMHIYVVDVNNVGETMCESCAQEMKYGVEEASSSQVKEGKDETD